MKKKFLILTILIAMTFCCFPFSNAFAEETSTETNNKETKQGYIINDIDKDKTLNFCIYIDTISSYVPIFKLPQSYYCKLISSQDGSNYLKVSYLGLEGYINTTNKQEKQEKRITDKNYHPDLNILTISIIDTNIDNYKNKTGQNLQAYYLGAKVTNDGKLTNKSAIKLLNSETIYFVDNTKIKVPKIPPRTDTSKNDKPSIIDGDAPTEPANNLLRTLLIIGICVPSIIIIFLLFKPLKKNEYEDDRNRHFNHDDYYDDYKDKHHLKSKHKR